MTEDELLCEQFMKLKNAGDPKAADLLGRVPVATDAPLAKADMDRLQTDFFLRDTIQVLSVTAEVNLSGRRAGLPPGCLVLVTHGNVAAPTLTEQTAQGTERSQRTMSNPDLIVEVRDGKIYGVRAELHMD
jgi:hypothetical protein